MDSLRALPDLLKGLPTEPEVAVRRALVLACELLAGEVAALEWDGTTTAVSQAGSTVEAPEAPPLDGDELVLQEQPRFAAAPLRDHRGTVRGRLWTVGGEGPFRPRDEQLLAALAEALTHVMTSSAPDPAAVDVEWVSRPFLDALHAVTGLASTYLTVVHEQAGQQEIRYSLNTREGFTLPEGLFVPWEDTLCKRALDEGRSCTTDVPAVWGDSEAATALGIQTYLSVPVRLPDGRLWGTLCAADNESAQDLEQHLPTFEVFSHLIGQEVVRDLALQTARAAAARARQESETDQLTGCTTRRVVEPWLAEQLARCGPQEQVVAVFVDLDHFKEVNDRLGHAAGDDALRRVGSQLRAIARPGDLVSRIGGDEFLVAARLPAERAERFAVRIKAAATYSLGDGEGTCSVGWATARAGQAHDLVAAADAAMYQDKRARREGAGRVT